MTMSNEIKRYQKIVKHVRFLERSMAKLSDEELSGLTDVFRSRLKNGETEDMLLPEAFAAMCEANRRVLGFSLYDVQLMGAIALHEGCLTEMGTGEGKTLTATLPLYLNAISGKSCILVTTNEYLATRDYEELGPVYRFMGLSVTVGVQMKQHEPLTNDEKREIYSGDILYTSHGALGFDYLFNNLVTSSQERFLRPFHYIIIDEADSVLLDSAQTPLVISGAPRVQSNLYQLANTFVTLLEENRDYQVEEQKVWLTPEGIAHAEAFFQIDNFYDRQYFEINRHVALALRAHMLFQKGKDYTVSRTGEIELLDSGTGRVMPGVKLRGGQHQALEVKEGMKDSLETRSVASITYQNLFLLFPKMSGMSGTLMDNKEELIQVYGAKVVKIPPNKPLIRRDLPDLFFSSESEKFDAAIRTALRLHRRGRPVLIVASTIGETERISKVLIQNNVPHNVLNANNAYWEASIIKEAGRVDAVTVATAMAGRGTDIKLGSIAVELGGLAVIGVGRMANIRIERQVRGRAGRQGDPGTSQFFVSLTDEVVQRNQIEQVERYTMCKKKPSSRKVEKIVNRAQAMEEEYAIHNRRTIVAYDRIIKKQRNLIYQLRNSLLDGGTIPIPQFMNIAEENIRYFLKDNPKPNQQTMNRYILDNLSTHVAPEEFISIGKSKSAIKKYLLVRVQQSLNEQKARIRTPEAMALFMRIAVLNAIDEAWVEEVDYLQQLQAAVMGRSSAQKNLVDEFQMDAYESYCKMERQIKRNLVRSILLSDVYMDEDEKLHIVFR